MNYWKAETLLAHGRGGQKKVGNNTYLHRTAEDTIALRLHATDVVLFHRDGSYTLNSGGWRTYTTKARINEFGPGNLYQTRGVWYLGAGGNRYVFEDGIKVSADGAPLDATPDVTAVDKLKRELDRKTAAYIRGFVESFKGKGLAQPGAGDCWGCYFQLSGDKPGPAHVQPLGLDHILQHMEEKYYVPSLVGNAIRTRGYQNPGVIWYSINADLSGRELADVLRAYFKKIKPTLLEEMKKGQ